MNLHQYITKHTLATFLTELTEKVEALRKKYPDAVYHGVDGKCSYAEGHIHTCGKDIPSGCILGEGMKEMGIDVIGLHEGFLSVMVGYLGTGFNNEIFYLSSIQHNQDTRIPWEVA